MRKREESDLMESIHLLPLHHGFYYGVGGTLHQQALVPIGVQRVGKLLGAAVVCWPGTGPAANRGRHCLNPLQQRGSKELWRERGGMRKGERVKEKIKNGKNQGQLHKSKLTKKFFFFFLTSDVRVS